MVPVRLHILFKAAAPIYGRKANIPEGHSVGNFHSEQICKLRGHYHRDGKLKLMRGYGARGHGLYERTFRIGMLHAAKRA